MSRAFERIAALIDGAQPFEPFVTPTAPRQSTPVVSVGEPCAVKPSGRGNAGDNGRPPQEGGSSSWLGHGPVRPVIQLAGGKLPLVVDHAEAALIASSPDLYRYGGQLVRPIVDEVPAADMTRTKVHRLLPVTRPYLVDVFTTIAQWQRYDRRCREWVYVDA